MALQWNWKDKCGEVTYLRTLPSGEEKTYTVNLYEGNAFLIFVNEYKENGQDMYSCDCFFVDEAHAKRCLGLEKGHSNIFVTPHTKLVKIKLDKSRYTKSQKLLGMFIKAFDELEIELYKEEAKTT